MYLMIRAPNTNAGGTQRGMKCQGFVDKEETYMDLKAGGDSGIGLRVGNSKRTVEQLVALYKCRNQLRSVKYTFPNYSGVRESQKYFDTGKERIFSTESERRPHHPLNMIFTRWTWDKLRTARCTLEGRGSLYQTLILEQTFLANNIYLGTRGACKITLLVSSRI